MSISIIPARLRLPALALGGTVLGAASARTADAFSGGNSQTADGASLLGLVAGGLLAGGGALLAAKTGNAKLGMVGIGAAALIPALVVGARVHAGADPLTRARWVHMTEQLSDWTPDVADNRQGFKNCAPTSDLMALRLAGYDVLGAGGRKSYEVTMGIREAVGAPGGTPYGYGHHESIFAQVGASWDHSNNLDTLLQWSREGHPIVLLGNPVGAWDAPISAGAGHSIVLSGFDAASGKYIVNDPLLTQGPILVTPGQLATYMANFGANARGYAILSRGDFQLPEPPPPPPPPTPEPTPTPAPETPAPAPAEAAPAEPAGPVAGALTYTVVRGDSLSVIADAHGVSLSDLRAVNGMPADQRKIVAGQVLKLPEGAVAPAAPEAAAPAAPAPDAPAAAAPAPAAPAPAAAEVERTAPLVRDMAKLVAAVADEHDVKHELAVAVMLAESSGDPDAVNPAGDRFGLFQLRARDLPAGMTREQAMDPRTNAEIAMKRLSVVVHEDPFRDMGEIAVIAQETPADQRTKFAARVRELVPSVAPLLAG